MWTREFPAEYSCYIVAFASYHCLELTRNHSVMTGKRPLDYMTGILTYTIELKKTLRQQEVGSIPLFSSIKDKRLTYV